MHQFSELGRGRLHGQHQQLNIFSCLWTGECIKHTAVRSHGIGQGVDVSIAAPRASMSSSKYDIELGVLYLYDYGDRAQRYCAPGFKMIDALL